jgi:hypothetical protein
MDIDPEIFLLISCNKATTKNFMPRIASSQLKFIYSQQILYSCFQTFPNLERFIFCLMFTKRFGWINWMSIHYTSKIYVSINIFSAWLSAEFFFVFTAAITFTVYIQHWGKMFTMVDRKEIRNHLKFRLLYILHAAMRQGKDCAAAECSLSLWNLNGKPLMHRYLNRSANMRSIRRSSNNALSI